MVIKKRGASQFYASHNKKGSSHFEILISFVLFVGFTLFLIFTLEPTKQDLLEESILFNVQSVFFEQTTTNVSYVLVDSNKDVKDEDKDKDTCNYNENKICYPPEIENDGYKIYVPVPGAENECINTIYASIEFINTVGKQCTVDEDKKEKYLIGYIYREDVLSNNSLITMRKKYYSDYANLKNVDLKVPEVVDFAIISSDSNFTMDKAVPDEAAVIAGTYRKKVLYANGSIINHDFTIKVW